MIATPRHGHAPIDMRKRSPGQMERPGDFYFAKAGTDGRSLYLALPYRDAFTLIHIPVSQGAKIDKHWAWDGNEDKPTLMPSVHTIGVWHGWVREGKLVEA